MQSSQIVITGLGDAQLFIKLSWLIPSWCQAKITPYLTITPEAIDLDSLNMSYIDVQTLRAAANSPIQGSSADIIKLAMIKLDRILQNYQARLLLQVHDELILEVPPEEWTELQPIIKSTMEDAVKLSIPLAVDINAGKNWMEAK